MDDNSLCDIFDDKEFGSDHFGGDDLFAILESLESDFTDFPPPINEEAFDGGTMEGEFKYNQSSHLISSFFLS